MITATIAPAELADHPEAAEGLLVLDVRTPAEFETAHIEGSCNVSLPTLTEHRDEVSRHLRRDVVLVCHSGARAQQAQDTLTAAAPANLHVLHGGITAWQAAGYRVVHGAPRWDLERQVRLVAGSIVLGGVLTSAIVSATKRVASGIGGGLTFAVLSNSCLMGATLSKLPYNRAAGPDRRQLFAPLAGR